MNEQFAAWLDAALENPTPDDAVAFGFNIYEDDASSFSVEIVAASRFDAEDPDWLCDEVGDFGTREEPFEWENPLGWENALEQATNWATEYLRGGKNADVLKDGQAVAIGFVDGDLQVLFEKTN